MVHSPGVISLTCLTENGALWRSHGGVVLDATAPVAFLEALRPTGGVVLEEVHVQDKDPKTTTRRMFLHDRLSRKELFSDPAGILRGVNQKLLQALGKAPPTPEEGLVLFTYRRAIKEPQLASVWQELLQGLQNRFRSVELHHYGNVRGYDHWFRRGFTTFVTVGDPIPNIGAAGMQAAAAGLDAEEAEEALKALARSELAQAHGRARDAQTGHRRHFHFGMQPPFGWDGSVAGLEVVSYEGGER